MGLVAPGVDPPENAAILALVRGCGFREVGRREPIGCLDGAWRDTIPVARRSRPVGVQAAGPGRIEGSSTMPANEYRFVTVWEVEGTPDEVFAVLDDPADLVRWWPSVYLDVVVEDPGDERGVGKVVRLLTKGRLPYRLRWSFRVTEKARPTRIVLDAWGDLDGHGEWTIVPRGPLVRAGYDRRVRADRPLLRHLSFLFKPVFSANHRWAMARGEESLRRELARRRTVSGQ